jgi:hypothetical protein
MNLSRGAYLYPILSWQINAIDLPAIFSSYQETLSITVMKISMFYKTLLCTPKERIVKLDLLS